MQAPTSMTLPTAPGINFHRHEIPAWLQTRYIETGYRANLNFLQCFTSIFSVHNEVVAIWTHLLPALVFGGLTASFFFSNHRHSALFAQTSFSFTLVFTASAFMHTFNPINEEWHLWTLGLDWAAIAFVIYGVGHSLSSLVYYHDPRRQDMWKLAFAVPCSAFASIASWGGFHYLPQVTKISLVLLPSLAILAFGFDLCHRLPSHELQIVKDVMRVPLLLTISGILVYGAQFPERQFQDINFDMTRGHHLYHHVWSSAFAFIYLRNTWKWAQKIGIKHY
ncbi:progestin receptor alpha [Seminavis robusta]|uniref:Progestin receptor alpha n=1 Tax=Seminavis robusta TaxID=568900 RepID=A0A9N8DIW9_9STRA|nr:progestin receptor alpha [Seminavis robusta]|eukprot:Sro85_g045300.1 progestin receptor alpha (279) ;mRNA; r:50014-50850